MEIFPAKVDLWFLGLFYGFGVLMIGIVPFIWRQPRGRVAGSLLVFFGILFVGIAWRVSEVNYVITEDGYLDATGWPLDGRITSLSAITRIEPSNDARASHAASLDRLRIDHGRGGLIFIAVHDKADFLDTLAAKEPGLVRTETGLRRAERTP